MKVASDSDIKNILVIKLRHIGDVLLTTPVFRALKSRFPGVAISVLINKGTEEVLTGNEDIDEIFLYEKTPKNLPPHERILSDVAIVRHLRKKRFDAVVDLTGNDRSAIIAFTSGAKIRLGPASFTTGFLGRKQLYTHITKTNSLNHMIYQHLEILKPFKINISSPHMDIHIPEAARKKMEGILKRIGYRTGNPLVHVHPVSRWTFKCWSSEKFAEVIRWLIRQGVWVAVTSSPDSREMEIAAEIVNYTLNGNGIHSNRLVDFAGTTTIKEVAALSAISSCFLGVDSAPMHIAAAVKTPVVALFGPSILYRWAPWSRGLTPVNTIEEFRKYYKGTYYEIDSHVIIQRDWDCVPCGRDGCDGTKISKCLVDIGVEEVKNILWEKLFTNEGSISTEKGR